MRILLALLLSAASFAQTSIVAARVNNVRYANQFTGANAGEMIHNAMIDLPATGGTVDARGLEGAQSITVNIWAGITKPIVLIFGNATYTDSSCWTIPNDGAATPTQKAIHIIGVGVDAASVPAGKTPASGTIINNSCNTAPAKIDTRGAGVLEVEGITFQDTSGSSNPFIQTTNTILKIHDDQFYGSKNGTANDQDAIILGGTSTVTDSSANAPFQGYGTVITHNFFNHIRRAVYGRTYANAVPVTFNTVWEQAGFSTGAPIEFIDSSGTNSNAGNLILGNTIEVINYKYCVRFLANGVLNDILNNGCYDGNLGPAFTAGVRFEGNSDFNTVVQGAQNDAYPGLSEDAGSTGKNEYRTSHQNQTSVYNQLNKFTSGSGITMAFGAVGARAFNTKLTTTNDEVFWQYFTSGGMTYDLSFSPAGGTAEQAFAFRRASATALHIKQNAVGGTGFYECYADCRFLAEDGSTAWYGTQTSPNDLQLSNTLATFNVPARILGNNGSANTLLITPPAGAGADTLSVTDSSANAAFDINGLGDISIPAVTNRNFVIVNQANKGIVLRVNAATDALTIRNDGKAYFSVGVCYNAAGTVCDTAGAGVPAGACTTGSTYRNITGGALTTLYVCEAAAWAAK